MSHRIPPAFVIPLKEREEGADLLQNLEPEQQNKWLYKSEKWRQGWIPLGIDSQKDVLYLRCVYRSVSNHVRDADHDLRFLCSTSLSQQAQYCT